MRKFKVGSRVEALKDSFRVHKGEKGTIVGIDMLFGYVTINFDNYNPNRHTGDELCEDGHGDYIHKDKLELFFRIIFKKNNLLV